MDYTLNGADIEPACLTLSDTAAALWGHHIEVNQCMIVCLRALYVLRVGYSGFVLEIPIRIGSTRVHVAITAGNCW